MAMYDPGPASWSPRPTSRGPSATPSPGPMMQRIESLSDATTDEESERMEPPLADTSDMNFVDGRCTCCPYGYHIDLDFLKYLENLNSGTVLKDLKKIHRSKKALRKSMEVYLHHQETNSTPPPDIINSTETYMNMVNQGNPNAMLDELDSSVTATINSIDAMRYQGHFSQKEAHFDRTVVERHRSEAEFMLQGQRTDSTSSLESQSTYSSESSPYQQQVTKTTTTVTSLNRRAAGMTSLQLANNMANLETVTSNGAISPDTLQAIREQMAISLQRMKELEEQVKAMPVLQVRINVLKEEKRLLGLQLKARHNKMNSRTVGVGDSRIDDDVEPFMLYSRYQTVTNINLSQLGLKSVANGELRPPRPACRSVGVGDSNVYENQVALVVGGGTKYHEKEFHTEQNTEIREKEVKTVFLNQGSYSDAQLRLLPPWKTDKKREKPERPPRRTRSVGVGDDDIFDSTSNVHVHEKELRTIYMADEHKKEKVTRNVGVLCRAAMRDVGVMYKYEYEKPIMRSISIGVGEIGFDGNYMGVEGEGSMMSTTSHTTHMALQQMNLAAFHSRHIHINNEQLLTILDTMLKKDLHSVSTQCIYPTIDKAIQHSADLTDRHTVGCGSDTIDVEVKRKVQTVSVGVQNRPLCMNRLIGTDKAYTHEVGTGTHSQMITKSRATNTDQVVMYPAAVNTDTMVTYTIGTDTEVGMFQALEAIRTIGTSTTPARMSHRSTNTERNINLSYHNFDFEITFASKGVNTDSPSGRKNVFDRGCNTESVRTFHRGSNTQGPKMVERGINVTRGYMPSAGVQTEVNSITRGVGECVVKRPSHGVGTGDMSISECENCHNRAERMRPVGVNTDPIKVKSIAVGYQSVREEGHMSEVTSDVYTRKLSPRSTVVTVTSPETSRITEEVTRTNTSPSTQDTRQRNVVIEKRIVTSRGAAQEVTPRSLSSDELEMSMGGSTTTTEETRTVTSTHSGTMISPGITMVTERTTSGHHQDLGEDVGVSSTQETRTITSRGGFKTSPARGVYLEHILGGHGVEDEIEETAGEGTKMKVIRHVETSYVGGQPVNTTTNVTLQDGGELGYSGGVQGTGREIETQINRMYTTHHEVTRDPGLGVVHVKHTLSPNITTGLPDVLNNNNDTVDYSKSVQHQAKTGKGRKIMITETRIERQMTDSGAETVTSEMSDNDSLRSIMRQPGRDKMKKEISFSQEVTGGYKSSSSEDEDEAGGDHPQEEGGSDSEGSQSSVSYDEGSYDGRAGKIVYTCKDDEAMEQGQSGAAMYEQNIRETYEMGEETSSACETYAQWLVDSTVVNTKQLNSALTIIQHEWFKVSSTKTSDPSLVEDLVSILNEFSEELMSHVCNLADANGNTALHYAVSHCNMEIVSLLLDTQVIDINKQNRAGYTAIMLASLAQVTTDRQREIISRMFNMGDVNARASQAGQTALMLAVSHGRQAMVGMLLESGASVNMQDEDGSTALMCASEHGHTDIVKNLLGQPDCDPTIQDNDGSSALSIAMEAGHRDIGVLLYAHVNFKQGSPILGRGKGKRRTPTGSSSSLSSSSSLNKR